MPQLNDQQRAAAEFQNGVALCIAIPGSGKTWTLTHRIANLVKAGVAPESILGITFTRNAAQTMRDRLIPILDDKASRVMLSTIHSFCYFLLKREGVVFEILDGKEQLIFLKKIMKSLGIRDLAVGMVLNEIRLAKSNLISSTDEFSDLYEGDTTMQKVAEIYSEYQAAKAKKYLFDFEDLLVEAYKLLSEDRDKRDKYLATFSHILVDEYQDTNPAQFEIIKLLAGDSVNGSFFAVGDDWQSIYAFTGATVGNILNFKTLFPAAQEFILNMNYRSTPQIIRGCQNLISHNTRKIEKELRTENNDGEDIVVLECSNEEDEAGLIAAEIQYLLEQKKYAYTDIAVLYRANFQSRVLEETFTKLNIPYHIENGLNFYQRREVKYLLDYLTLIVNPDSEEADIAFASIYNIPNRYFSRVFFKDIQKYSAQQGIHLYQGIKEMPKEPAFVRHNVLDMIRFLDPLIDNADELEPAELIELLREGLEYDSFITDDDIPAPDDQKIANINQLQLAATRFDQIQPFLEYTKSFKDEAVSDSKDGVRLMTIHKAKGMEFPVVFIPGMVEGIMPTKRGDLEEERRICFVGISRAMDLLYLSHSHIYLGQPAKKSLFLDEILGKNQP